LTVSILLLNSCITPFIPEITGNKELLIVEGLITDQPGVDTIKLSRSLPLGVAVVPTPVKGYYVTITDDIGNTFHLKETEEGTYVTDSATFRGIVGRIYTLHISSNSGINNLNYESYPVEMKPVPPIDSIYYEKVKVSNIGPWIQNSEACQIFLDTHDPSNKCKYFRWEYTDTWEFIIPYPVPNNTCWASSVSDKINIRNTTSLTESKITKYPLSFVSNNSDRLSVKYSILVNQYSLNEDEYLYWDKLQRITQEVGSLYDIIPSSVPSNVYCINNPGEQVLGYFSVSATTSKRFFIKDHFYGLAKPYSNDSCIADTVWRGAYIPNLGYTVWVLIDNSRQGYQVITYTRGCADCTTRGTTTRPAYWNDVK
jgi:hypothetical protein